MPLAITSKTSRWKFPVGLLTCITGVSGSGKSTLINDTLYRAVAQHLYGSSTEPAAYGDFSGLEFFDKVVDVDQSPIGRTPRSNPATYTGLFTPIRDLFAAVPESRARGYGPGRYSFCLLYTSYAITHRVFKVDLTHIKHGQITN